MSHQREGASETPLVTIRIEEPFHYSGSQVGSWRYRWHRMKLRLAYYHYRRWLYRYAVSSHIRDAQKAFIAETGCGSGYLLSLLEEWFSNHKVIGLDHDPSLLDRAKQQASRCHLIQGNAEMLPFVNASLAIVVALHVVEHLYHPEHFASEAARVLLPGGALLIATPNPTGIGAGVMKSRWTGWREDHVSVHSPKEWTSMFERCGFSRVYGGTTGLSGFPCSANFL